MYHDGTLGGYALTELDERLRLDKLAMADLAVLHRQKIQKLCALFGTSSRYGAGWFVDPD